VSKLQQRLDTCQTQRVTVTGDDTRTRILDTAWELVREQGTADVTIAGIAAGAGVTRQLVYFHFANRAGLLTAMARRRDRESGFAAAVVEARRLDPVAGFEHLLRAWCSYLPEILPVARALEAALVTGDQGGSAWRDRMGELHGILRAAVARLPLAPGWTVDGAADWAWARIQPSSWQHLVGERGWSTAEYTDRTVASLLRELTG
jgi:AcrR family transcriptional regulator